MDEESPGRALQQELGLGLGLGLGLALSLTLTLTLAHQMEAVCTLPPVPRYSV